MSSQFISWLFDFILPPRKSEALVAELTAHDLEALRSGSALPYQAHEVQALVWELKYYGNKRAAALAGQLLAEDLLAIASEELGRPLLMPVPMHWGRLSERGHNHTELLCEAALRHLEAPEDFSEKTVWPAEQDSEDFFVGKSSGAYEYAPRALTRTKLTQEQQKLSREHRLSNVKNSMHADRSVVQGRVCVVVDDVTTTGATLAEAARALKEAGALRVHCVALAQS